MCSLVCDYADLTSEALPRLYVWLAKRSCLDEAATERAPRIEHYGSLASLVPLQRRKGAWTAIYVLRRRLVFMDLLYTEPRKRQPQPTTKQHYANERRGIVVGIAMPV